MCVFEDRLMVGTYNGVFECDLSLSEKKKVDNINYVSGSINEIDGEVYFNQDVLKIYDKKNRSAKVLHLATEGNRFRKLIRKDTSYFALRTLTIERISLRNGYRTIKQLKIRSNPTDLEADTAIYYSNEAGEVATMHDFKKISDQPIIDLDLDDADLHAAAGSVYFRISKKDLALKSSIDLHVPIFEIILLDGNTFLLTKNGLFLLAGRKLYKIIDNVEFNTRAAFNNNSKLFLGTTYGLLEIDLEVLRKTVLPNLEYKTIENLQESGKQSGLWKALSIAGFISALVVTGLFIYYMRRRQKAPPEQQEEFKIELATQLIENGEIKNVNELAAYFRISRVTLNKRFNAIGKSPNELVREIKTRRVHTLHQNGEHSVQQIAEKVGYSESVVRKILKTQ